MRLARQVPTLSSLARSQTATVLISAVWVPLLISVMNSVPTQLYLWRRADKMLDRTVLEDGANFDFIVVGAGLAGSVVASRLTHAGHSVLLLEAGGEPYPFQMVPGFLMAMINRPETDYMYRSVPQKKASLNSINAESSWSVGKGLGGTGTLNIMIFLRGHQKDFDNWASIVNDSSWSFDGLLPHFKSIEEYSEKMGKVDARYHGSNGDMLIDEPDYLGIADEFVAAANEFGYPKVDLNTPFSEGFDRIKYPIKDGRRIAPYSAFIQPLRQLPNIKILKYAHVNRVLLDGDNKAYGIEYEKFGKTQTAFANREVILSAGSVNSAKILLLSGIGPKEHLRKIGIPVKQNLPVGQNLQDHLGVYLHPFYINNQRQTIRMERDMTPTAFNDFLQHGTGVLTSSGVQATGCITSSFAKSRGESGWPDIHYFLYGFSASSSIASVVSNAFNLQEQEMQEYYKRADEDGRDSFYIIVTGARPFSKGHIQLQSRNSQDAPIIDPKYLEDPNDIDLQVLLEAVKKAVEIVENSTAIGKNLEGQFARHKLPGCEEHEIRSDAYWTCYIRRYSVTLHHPVGTARMGREDDEEAVVDTRLRVRGVKNLRVIDSSIQPVIIVTNTGASAMAIGEKGASMVLDDWAAIEEDNADWNFWDLGSDQDEFANDNLLLNENGLKRRRFSK